MPSTEQYAPRTVAHMADRAGKPHLGPRHRLHLSRIAKLWLPHLAQSQSPGRTTAWAGVGVPAGAPWKQRKQWVLEEKLCPWHVGHNQSPGRISGAMQGTSCSLRAATAWAAWRTSFPSDDPRPTAFTLADASCPGGTSAAVQN